MSRAGLTQRTRFDGPAPVAQAQAWALDYLAVRELRINGKVVPAEGKIDKSQLTPRKVLQMYERRQIKIDSASETKTAAATKKVKPGAIGPTDLFNPGVCGHKVVPIKPEPKGTERVASRRSAPRAKSRRAA
jgi:hypothetical protein